ncbi:hypothetical protein V6N00_13915 [Tersicoccus sp. MR15.9]|uniref:hypothetical protein n=1 Tax=Tersicoccus mangrovi TaxID=3121635 RepID=UPI002FE5365D
MSSQSRQPAGAAASTGGQFRSTEHAEPDIALGAVPGPEPVTEPPAGAEPVRAVYRDPYPDRKGSERIVEDCGKCAGTGLYTGPYGHSFYTPAVGAVDTGCFGCMGTGKHSFLVSSARERERRRVGRANESIDRVDRFNENLAAAVAAHPSLALLQDWEIASMAWVDQYRTKLFAGPLSEDQMSAAAKAIDRYHATQRAELEREAAREAERAARPPAPVGPATIEGVVISTKFVDNSFSYSGGSTMKMRVKDDRGFEVWSTAPATLRDAVRNSGRDQYLAGSRVRFNATLKPSHDDPSFAFASRPTKAELLPPQDTEDDAA